ncbi:MAG TPA: hypothetical protein VFA94_07025 [Acidimicrobiales bacterium]|nr:hypothetical protein [Acidimicrobiales bacterium]
MDAGPDLEVVELDGPVPPPPPPSVAPEAGFPVWLVAAAVVLALLVVRATTSSPHPARAGAAPLALPAHPLPARPSEVGTLYACDGRMDGVVIFGSLPPGQVVQVQATPLRGPDVDVPGPPTYRIGPDGRLQLDVAGLHVPGTFGRLSFLATPQAESAVIGWSVGVPVVPCSGRARATAPR